MKRVFSAFLAFALSFCLFSVPALAEEPVPAEEEAVPAPAEDAPLTVQRSDQTVTLDGVQVTPDVYNINGSNYFKLRDLAALLSGTPSQFDVAFDEASRSVTLFLRAPYTPVVGELIEGEDLSATCVQQTVPLLLSSPGAPAQAPESAYQTACDMTVFNIGGNNYFKLRDLAALVGFGVHYNPVTDTAVILSDPVDKTDWPATPFENFIFLGDSLISNPHWVSDTWRKHGHQVLAGGGAGVADFLGVTTSVRTVGGIGPMRGTLQDKSFNGIVVLLGANNLGGRQTVEQVMDLYTQLIDELKTAFPDIPLFVLKVFPVNRVYNYHYGAMALRMDLTNAFNAAMEEYLLTRRGVWFVDATADFTDEDGLLIHDGSDGLHISSVYYEDFYSAIEQALYATGVVIPPVQPETPPEA